MAPFRFGKVKSVFLCALSVVFFATDSTAQSTGSNGNSSAQTQLNASPWTVGCRPVADSKELLCEASHTTSVVNTRQTLLAVYVTPWKQEKAPPFVMRFQLPHGLNIPSGLNVKIDDKAVPAPVIMTSNRIGVFAQTPLTDKLLGLLKKGVTMQVSFSAMNGRELGVPVSLEGFSAVYAKLQ